MAGLELRHGRECGPCGSFTMTCIAFVCEECGHSFSVPRCLTEEVRMLHSKGVGIRAAGCLRWCDTGFIKVSENHIPFMELFDYKHVSPESLGFTDGKDRYFIPKTVMPVEKDPKRWEDWVRDHE